ncbi:MAG: AmmeMemoRadiSam system protein A, partial [Lachnospiraceae bacterium]|nr:AmmeMemoRadiSam system protein A [Lachnospiraceae bacterium]
VYIASGDLSHKLKDDGPYGFDPAGPEYDDRIMDVMGRGAFEELFSFDEHFLEKCAECGHRSFVMMAGAFDRTDVEIKKYCHQDVTGVGYGICSFMAGGENDGRAFLDAFEAKEQARRDTQHRKEDLYVRLARKSLESYITGRQVIDWDAEKDALTSRLRADRSMDENGVDPAEEIQESVDALSGTRAGAFVSLHKEGQLRGCIGTIAPTRENLAKEIIENAISAAVHDSRFMPVTEDELDKIEYSVDVLGEAEDIDSEEMLDVKRYGVIVTKGGRRGLLLPNLDGVDTIEEQLSIAKRKAGLKADEKGCSLQRFEVVRHF